MLLSMMLSEFLKCDFKVFPNIDFLQLNTRWYNKESFYLNFDGFESYILTNRCAKIFVETTHDSSHFENKVFKWSIWILHKI